MKDIPLIKLEKLASLEFSKSGYKIILLKQIESKIIVQVVGIQKA